MRCRLNRSISLIMAYSFTLKIFLLLCSIFFSESRPLNLSSSSSSSSSSSVDSHLSAVRSVCNSTPYPDVCFDSLKLSISISISPNIISSLLQSLQIALSEAGKLSNLFSSAGAWNIVENQRGAVQDCKDLHQITLISLHKSVSRVSGSADSTKLADARTFLSAALTNKNTCLEGLASASGLLKPTLVNSLVATYKHVSNSLSLLSNPAGGASNHKNRRHLLDFPEWLSRKDRRILQSSGDEYDPSSDMLVVATDGSGNFTTITDAINFAPNNSLERIIIYVREGVYEENVDIPSYKPNIVLLGDGSDVSVITGNRSAADGWTTFRSATVAVSGEGFLARDIGFENRAGAGKYQAVALRINADLAAVYRCSISGYQDTLYVHSFRQFYRECDIFGSIDFIFGNAVALFQACNIVSRMPMPGQFTVITAQSRDSPDEDTGISIQNCSIVAEDDVVSSSSSGVVKSYLGRPWRPYSRTVVMQSYMGEFVDPSGWRQWSSSSGDDPSLETLYFGEYDNDGPGSSTEDRVGWPGYHVMDYDDASNFTVSEFLSGDQWLQSTSFPYDDGLAV